MIYKKIAILHFNIIEKYPPVMNFIFDALEENPDVQITVITTKNTTTYKTPFFSNTKIYRFGKVSCNPIVRYVSYIWFNLASFVILLFRPVNHITVFESLSSMPLWLISRIRPKTNAHIHFHEYISEPERRSSSSYMRLLFRLENQLLKKYTSSQTNEDRKCLFLRDKSFLTPSKVEVRPNMPPKAWWLKRSNYKMPISDGKIKLVYVGACDNNTMYIKEILKCIDEHREKIEFTIYSHQLEEETRNLILSFNNPSISINPPIDYYDLPNELINYDVGLVLYKGHIPNFVYNVPNKVFEYLACGLKVIVDKNLKTTVELKLDNLIPIEFSKLDNINFIDLIELN
jgi:hypothetical protein